MLLTFSKDEVKFVNKMYKEAKREEHRRFTLNSSLYRENLFGIDPNDYTEEIINNSIQPTARENFLQATDSRIELQKHHNAVNWHKPGFQTPKEFDKQQIATRKWLDSIFVQPSMC